MLFMLFLQCIAGALDRIVLDLSQMVVFAKMKN